MSSGNTERKTRRIHRGSGDGMCARGNDRQHGKPQRCGCVNPQLALREEQAGPHGAADRPVVVMKPGNAGGAKGPWFKESARRSEGRGDWREPNNPTEGRETTECATRESEGIAQFSFLQSVRQDVSQGRALDRLLAMPEQRRLGRSRRTNVRAYRSVRHRTMGGRTGGRTEEEGLSM